MSEREVWYSLVNLNDGTPFEDATTDYLEISLTASIAKFRKQLQEEDD
jgi:hypothetical protein